MVKSINLFFTLIIFSFIVEARNPSIEDKISGKVKTQDGKGLRVRSCPSLKCSVVDGLSEGKVYYFSDRKFGEWLKINNGYVHADYVKNIDDELKKDNISFNYERSNIFVRLMAHIFNDLGLREHQHVVTNTNNGFKVHEMTYATPDIFSFKIEYKKKVYTGRFGHSYGTQFTDGDKIYCTRIGSSRKNKGRKAIIFNTSEDFKTLNADNYTKVYDYSDIKKKLVSYNIDQLSCNIDEVKSEIDIQKYTRYSKLILFNKDKFIDYRNKKYKTVLKNNKIQFKNHIGRIKNFFNDDLVAIRSSDTNPKTDDHSFLYFKSKNKKNHTFNNVIKDMPLKFEYKTFSAYYRPRKSYDRKYHLYIYASEDMQINDFKILKGEYIDINDIVVLSLAVKKFPTLRKNIDIGFARSIDEKNKSVGDLFFDLSKIKPVSDFYQIPSSFVTYYDDYFGHLVAKPRKLASKGLPDDKYTRANKYVGVPIRFALNYATSPDEHPHNCVDNESGLTTLESKIKEWGLPLDHISKIYYGSLANFVIEINKHTNFKNFTLTPGSKINVQKNPCHNYAKIISIDAAKQSIYNETRFKSSAFFLFEKEEVILGFEGSKNIFSKYDLDLDFTLDQEINEYPLCVKNIHIKENPLSIDICGQNIDDFQKNFKAYKVQSYNKKDREVIVKGHKYSTDDITSLAVARLGKKEYWLPFVPNLDKMNYFDRRNISQLEKLVEEDQIYKLTVNSEDFVLAGKANYCGYNHRLESETYDVGSGKYIAPQPILKKVHFKNLKGKEISIKLYEPLRRTDNICYWGC